MADLSKLSDNELMALYNRSAAPSGGDLASMSDADLLALHRKVNGPTLTPAEHPSLSAGETAADVAKSGGIGLVKGALATAGAAGDVRNLASKGIDYLGEKLGASPDTVQSAKDWAARLAGINPVSRVMSLAPSTSDLQRGVEGITGAFYQPKTTLGEYAQTGGEFVPALLGGEGSLGARLATRVALPAISSETAGQLTKGTDLEPWARAAGAIFSPAAVSAGRRVVTPLATNATRSDLARILANEGVDVTAGQRTGNKPLQWMESALGDMLGAGGGSAQRQQEQFTAAALRRAGETANRANPDVIDNAFTRIGRQFETIGARNHVAPDQPFINDMVRVRDDYNNLVGPHARAPVVENSINDIANQMGRNGGVLSGEQYNAMTSRLAQQAREAKADPQLQRALQGIREGLDDAFERTLQTSGNTADLEALRTARRQYRNMLVLEKAATGAGSDAAEGLISPSQLRGAVVQQGRRGYARGQGDYADLARAGEALLKPLPQSGTAPRQNVQHLVQLLASIASGAAGGAAGPVEAALGATAGFAAPAAAGRLLMSRPVQAYLGNQLLQPAQSAGAVSNLARTLAAAKAAGVNQSFAPSDTQGNLARQ